MKRRGRFGLHLQGSSLLGARKFARCTPIESLESRTLLSTTWYVATTGSNANPGTLALPFKTIQFAANAAHPGDTVDIRGGTYHETVTVHNSGTGRPARITFQPYSNESVTVDGADPITGWTNAGGSVYTASMLTDLGYGNNQVFVDGQMINEARWPNTSFDLSHPTLETATAITATTTTATITDANLTQSAGFWVGATIRIGSGVDWVNQTGTVTASAPGTLTFSYQLHEAPYTIPISGNQYYLFGVAGALDSAGEWFRSSTGQVSAWMPASDSPTKHVVEAKTRLYGFDLSSASYIRINGIHFFACTVMTTSKSASDTLNQITAKYVSQFSLSPGGFLQPIKAGIVLAGSNDVLQNSVIDESAGDGVYVSGSYVVVNNNLIHDVDYAGIDAAPIRIGGYGDTISHNTCYNTGRNGLLFSGNHDTVTYNNVYNYGLQCTDLGGFYSGGFNGNGTVIAYNEFHDATQPGYGCVGIMLDNGSSNFLCYRNIIWNVNTGVRIVAMITKDVANLSFYNNTIDALKFSIDKDGFSDDWTTVLFENNILTHPIQFGVNAPLIDNISNHGQFVDAAHGNFTLLPGAPALDTGLIVPPYTNGFVGIAPDVGALELGTKAFFSGVTTTSLPTGWATA